MGVKIKLFIKRVTGLEWQKEIDTFYESQGSDHRARVTDLFFVAVEDNQIIGVVRYCVEEGTSLLRSMLVHSEKRGKALGQQIIYDFERYLEENHIQETYCIAYSHLDKFYNIVGFKIIEPSEAPEFLYQRYLEYIKKACELKTDKKYIMMKRVSSDLRIIVETERLLIRQMVMTDYDNLYALDSDPDVMKYISSGKVMTSDEVKSTLERIIARYNEWKVFGVWAAELKSTGEFIGWFSLKPLPGTSEIEIGYRLLKKHWGKGYATEGAAKLLDYGLHKVNLKKIVAIANPQNNTSKKVLEKIGLKYTGEVEYQSPLETSKNIVSWFELIKDFQ